MTLNNEFCFICSNIYYFMYILVCMFQPSTNGLISFGKAFVGRDPVSLGLNNDGFEETIAAPYWFRQDLRRVQPSNQ